MDKFDLKINEVSQLKVRKANELPKDNSSTALAWFDSKPVTPANNLSITDLSNFIPENSYSSDVNSLSSRAKNKIVFSNELGILEDQNGQTVFDTDDISVTDIFLNAPAYDKRYYEIDLKNNNFVHSYYVSRYYTLTERDSYTFVDFDDFIEENKIPFSIKVVNEYNEEYIDKDTGIKKYRILLEQLKIPEHSSRTSVPTKIIVLFNSPSPNNLSLIYDKVTISENNDVSSIVPQYKENINTVSIYNKVSEESFVIDNSSRDKKIYSKKSVLSKKNLISGLTEKAEGFEVFVPKKAISDSRTYESFNWRLIAKVKKSINVSTVNNNEEIDSESNIKQKVVNAAVLYSGDIQVVGETNQKDYSPFNPYVFYRLSISPFNISNFIFQNPIVEESFYVQSIGLGKPAKNQADYWLVNIDNITDEDLSKFDILAWSPSNSISPNNGLKIKKYIEKTQGTLILDLSNVQTPSAENIDPSLSTSSEQYALDTWSYNLDNVFLNEQKNNAWPLNQSIFERLTIDQTNYDVYSIFGRSKLPGLVDKKVKEFTGSISESNVVLKNSRGKPLFVSLQFDTVSDTLSRGNLLITTTPILKYCNDLYQPSSLFDIATSNSGSVSLAESAFTVSAAIEGPMKIVYNSVSISLLSRIFSSKIKDLRSSVYYHLSNWDFSYVINSNALLDDEKKQEYVEIKDKSVDSVGISKYAKNLIPNNSSVVEFYKKSVYDFLSDQYNLVLQELNPQDIEFYVEVTNPDVIIANATKVVKDYSSQDVEDIPTSYTVYKLNSQEVNSSLYAYTNTPSAEFKIPGGFGPYVIRQRIYRSPNQQINDRVMNLLSSNNIYKSYSFSFSIFSSYAQSKESPLSFSASWSVVLSAIYTATLSRDTYYKNVSPPGTVIVEANKIVASYKFEPDEGETAIFSNADRRQQIVNTSDPANNFMYTNDITNGNINAGYSVGKSGLLPDYVAYIQISLREYSSQTYCNITKVYDAQTEKAVKIFQRLTDARFEDGKVDSETKALFAKYLWKKMKDTEPERYATVIERIQRFNPGSVKYVQGAANSIAIHELPSRNNPGNYRKITFSGSSGPNILHDTIFVYLPERYLSSTILKDITVRSITVYPGEFAGTASYKGIEIFDIKCIPLNPSDSSIDYTKPKIIKGKVPYTKSPILAEVNLPSTQAACFAIKIRGGSLGGNFGPYTEGYSLNKIEFDISYKYDVYNDREIIEDGYKLETKTADVTVTYNAAGIASNISANKAEIIDLSGLKSVKYATSPVSITYPTWSGLMTLDLTKTKIDFSSKEYKPPFTPYSSDSETPSYKDESITIDLTSTRTVSVQSNSLSLSNVLSSTNNPVSNSSVTISLSGSKLVFETSSLNYENSNVIKTEEKTIENYWLLKDDGSIIKNSKNTITVLDGLVMLCQPSDEPALVGKPYGINLQDLKSSNLNSNEINIDYGSLILNNNLINNGGLVTGFYDRNKKEFLGNNLYYVDLVARGVDNVYIAAIAVDADGNLGTGVDFFGPKTNIAIRPADVPVKMACPIYNVEYIPSSRIGISHISPNLSKLEQWPVNITAGSFTKTFYIDPSYGWTSWLKNYEGKYLRATYSTLGINNVVWSQWAGKPYIDVFKETPIILSSRRIQLTKVPLATLHQPAFTKIGETKNFVKIYIKSSDDQWEVLNEKYIRNINAFTGIIDFVTPVATDPDSILVDYTTRASGIPLKVINGSRIPINPFLNRDTIEPEKPLHIYIKPSRIEVINQSINSYTLDFIPDYTYDSPIDFTYNTSIFNPYNSSSYDPFSLQIGLIHVLNSVDIKDISLEDLRIKGGGVKSTMGKNISLSNYGSYNINVLFKTVKEASSFWDVYPAEQQAYSKGGFIIIKMPREVLNNFTSEQELYSIISRNITAGVVYKIQDMEGNDWGVLE